MPTISNLALSTMGIVVLIMLWRWQHNHPHFDLADLITGDNGRVSSTKTLKTGGWAIGTWGFITLIQQGKMTEWYFIGYMTASFGVAVFKDVFSKPAEEVKT